MLVPFGAWEAGCYREVAALYSDHYRQVPLYIYVSLHTCCGSVSEVLVTHAPYHSQYSTHLHFYSLCASANFSSMYKIKCTHYIHTHKHTTPSAHTKQPASHSFQHAHTHICTFPPDTRTLSNPWHSSHQTTSKTAVVPSTTELKRGANEM